MDNLPLTLHELAQALTKDSDALDIDTIGSRVHVDSVLRPLDALVLPGVVIIDFGNRVAFRNSTALLWQKEASDIPSKFELLMFLYFT